MFNLSRAIRKRSRRGLAEHGAIVGPRRMSTIFSDQLQANKLTVCVDRHPVAKVAVVRSQDPTVRQLQLHAQANLSGLEGFGGPTCGRNGHDLRTTGELLA